MHAPPARPLDVPEQILWWLDRGAPLHFTTVVDVDGPLDTATLRTALGAVTARHPSLRATITGPPEALRFEPAPPEAAVTLAVEALPEDAWPARLTAEIATPMPPTDGPLLRVTCLEAGPLRRRLLLTCHHAIADGRSGVYLVRDLLEAATGTPRPPRPAAPGLENARPPRHRGLFALATAVASLARDALRALRFGRPRLLTGPPPFPLARRRPEVLSRTFPAPLVSALTDRARAAGTTVHGLMMAALLQAVAAELGGVTPLACGSPVDLRPHLRPPVEDDLGYYVGLSQALHRVDPAGDPLALAVAVRRDLVRDLARGVPTKFHAVADLLFRILRRGRTPAAFAEAMYHLPLRAAVGITNLGRLDVPVTYGPLRTTALFFAVAPSGLADFVSTATCHDGTLRWTFTALAPVVDAARAKRLVDDTARRLVALG